MQQELIDFLFPYAQWIYWLTISSLALFVVSLFILPAIIKHIPADYFTQKERFKRKKPFSISHLFLLFVKNCLGFILLACGAIMLITPGQGVLTLLAGLFVLDFPGKYKLERYLVQKPIVLNALNWVRRKQKVQDLRID